MITNNCLFPTVASVMKTWWDCGRILFLVEYFEFTHRSWVWVHFCSYDIHDFMMRLNRSVCNHHWVSEISLDSLLPSINDPSFKKSFVLTLSLSLAVINISLTLPASRINWFVVTLHQIRTSNCTAKKSRKLMKPNLGKCTVTLHFWNSCDRLLLPTTKLTVLHMNLLSHNVNLLPKPCVVNADSR